MMVTEIIQDVAIVFLAVAVIVETLHLKMLDKAVSSLCDQPLESSSDEFGTGTGVDAK